MSDTLAFPEEAEGIGGLCACRGLPALVFPVCFGLAASEKTLRPPLAAFTTSICVRPFKLLI
jgi:hypothetical protein